MDELDEKILGILKKDARESFVNIAATLGTSEGTVRARTRKLIDEGVITQFTIRTAAKTVKALVDIKGAANVNTSSIASAIIHQGGVDTIYEVSGESDLVAVINVTSTTTLNEIIEEIRGHVDVVSTQTRLVLKEH